MKKIISALLIVLTVTFTFTACSAAGSISSVSTVKPEYENEKFKTLAEYLRENELISENAVKTDASQIGALEGYRYSSSDFGSFEIYYYTDFSSDYYKDAEDGEIELYGEKFDCVVSGNGNFLLIYSKDIDTSKLKEGELNLIDAVKSFPNVKTSENASDSETKGSE